MQTSFAEIPDELWNRIQVWIPRHRRSTKGGRPPIADRRAMSGILYRLRTGCQWDAIPSEFGSRSTCYRRFVAWTNAGVFKMMHVEMLLYYDEKRGIDWNWCSLDRQRLGEGAQRGASPEPILQIVESLAPSATSSPTGVASPSPLR